MVSPADLAACRQMIRDGSKSFHLASLLLPEHVRDPARALYAFCRLSDDLIDREGGGKLAITELRRRLDRIYTGHPDAHPADRAFADVVKRFSIPQALPEALIEGFEWDVDKKVYYTISDVRAYGARVAGSVGAMMAIIMGVRDAFAIARATDLGIAMQLTNIARDVGEDARAGRIYLPQNWLQSSGIEPSEWVKSPQHDPGISEAIRRLLSEADRLYARAEYGISMLPMICRPAINASQKLYSEIGREVERHGHNSIATRAVVSRRRKLFLLFTATSAIIPKLNLPNDPPLAEAKFLVDEVVKAPRPVKRPKGLEEQVVWVIDLFSRLSERQL